MEPPFPPDDPVSPAPLANPDAEFAAEVFGPFAFDSSRKAVIRDGRRIAMTTKEFALALTLFRNLGQPISRGDLLVDLWNRAPDSPTRTVDAHIGRVRAKLDLHPSRGYRLTPIYAFGYRLDHVPDGEA